MKNFVRTFPIMGGILLGIVGLLAVRFVTYQKENVHYHANFAVYINGKREEFKNPIYYSEGGCTSEGVITPVMRAHMHENVSDVVHVEDHAVTWGNFFENLWWSLGSDFIQKSDGTLYKADDTNELHVYVNGEDYTGFGSIANREIDDKDRVLISYGSEDRQMLDKQYQSIASSATKYDSLNDPVACGGSHRTTITDRLKHLF